MMNSVPSSKILDNLGMTIKISEIPEYIVLGFLRDTNWYKNKGTFYGKYIRPWLEWRQTRIFDKLFYKAQCEAQLAILAKTMEKAENKLNNKR